MNTILAIGSFLALPYLIAYDIIRGRFGGNSGHTAGLCEGFVLLVVIVSGAIQLTLVAIGLIVWYAVS